MIQDIVNWTNTNSGFLGLLLFIGTILYGWLSGIFRFLRHKPVLKLSTIPGPTFCSILATGKKEDEYDVHRTAIAIYLKVVNIGSAPCTIETVQAAFHWHLNKISWLWIRYHLFWSWVEHPTIILEDFQHNIGENIKVYPSLLQASNLTGNPARTYLEEGRSVNGVIYFETPDAWGGCFPSPRKDQTVKIRVAVVDSYGSKHKKTFTIPIASLAEGKEYNPSWGETFATLRDDEDITDFANTLNK
jgi:hypothetical protein